MSATAYQVKISLNVHAQETNSSLGPSPSEQVVVIRDNVGPSNHEQLVQDVIATESNESIVTENDELSERSTATNLQEDHPNVSISNVHVVDAAGSIPENKEVPELNTGETTILPTSNTAAHEKLCELTTTNGSIFSVSTSILANADFKNKRDHNAAFENDNNDDSKHKAYKRRRVRINSTEQVMGMTIEINSYVLFHCHRDM